MSKQTEQLNNKVISIQQVKHFFLYISKQLSNILTLSSSAKKLAKLDNEDFICSKETDKSRDYLNWEENF